MGEQLSGLRAAVIHHGALRITTASRGTCLEVQMEQFGLLTARVGTFLTKYTVLKKWVS